MFRNRILRILIPDSEERRFFLNAVNTYSLSAIVHICWYRSLQHCTIVLVSWIRVHQKFMPL